MADDAPESFYPARVPVEAYGPGGFRFAGMQHSGSLLILNDGIHRWQAPPVASLAAADFAAVLKVARPGQLLLLGTGASIARPPAPVRMALEKAGVSLDFMDTGAAVRTWNVLVAEDRDALCALITP